FVSDGEVQDICDYVSKQAKPKYEDAFLRLEMLDGGVGIASSSEQAGDPLYDEVKEFIISTRKASTSLIQRKFSIGYARAARLIDTMEENGIIGPARGSKPREVYIKNEEEYYE
ncbi:MAG: DNA translocase FtsK, partial [Longicatena sp.]